MFLSSPLSRGLRFIFTQSLITASGQGIPLCYTYPRTAIETSTPHKCHILGPTKAAHAEVSAATQHHSSAGPRVFLTEPEEALPSQGSLLGQSILEALSVQTFSSQMKGFQTVCIVSLGLSMGLVSGTL